ncbi:hypothetical protein [Nocardia colli]|uniref:hypothetical protein n=1 Tax=Nocardia colli TaxID=2545717 RepID=UPI0035E26783
MSSPAPPAGPAAGPAPAPGPDATTVQLGQEGLPKVGEWASAGGYRLAKLDDGSLQLTGPNGEITRKWAPDGPVDPNKLAYVIDQRGNLRVVDAVQDLLVPHTGSIGPTFLPITGFELGKDGSLVALGPNSARVPISSAADARDAANSATLAAHHGQFDILHLQPESDALKHAIDLGQAAINKLTDPAQVGTLDQHAAPTVKGELVAAQLVNDGWDSTMYRDYQAKVADMQKVTDRLNADHAQVSAVAATVPPDTQKALNDIGGAVSMLNTLLTLGSIADGWGAKPAFPNDAKLIQAVYDTIKVSEETIGALKADLDKKAGKVGDATPAPDGSPPPAPAPPAPTPPAATPASPAPPSSPPAPAGSPSPAPSRGAGAPSADLADAVPGLADVEGADAAGAGGADARGAGSGADGSDAAKNVSQTGTTAPGAVSNALTQALPALAMAMTPVATAAAGVISNVIAQQQRQQELDRQRQAQQPAGTPPPQAPAPPAAAPPSAPPPVTSQPAVPPAAAPPGTPAAPARNVDLPLDGHTYRVSSVVAEAVHNAMNNPNGSDGVAAYNGAAGDPDSWSQVTEANVKTGDVAQWGDNRTALVVANETGLHMIVNGQLVPLDPNNPPDDGHGAYGEFRFFLHPTGVGGADPGVPGPAVPALPPPPAVTTSAPR